MLQRSIRILSIFLMLILFSFSVYSVTTGSIHETFGQDAIAFQFINNISDYSADAYNYPCYAFNDTGGSILVSDCMNVSYADFIDRGNVTTSWDNTWYLIGYNNNVQQRIINDSRLADENNDQGIEMQVYQSGYLGMMYPFSTAYDFGPGSTISLECGENTAGKYTYIYFWSNNVRESPSDYKYYANAAYGGFSIRVNNTDLPVEEQSYRGMTPNLFYDCALNCQNNSVTVNWTDLKNDCGITDPIYYTNIGGVEFREARFDGGDITQYWDNFFIDIQSGNELPSFNVTTSNETYCFNSSKGYVDVGLEVSANDPENDTIYYALSQVSRNSLKYDQQYGWRSCVFNLDIRSGITEIDDLADYYLCTLSSDYTFINHTVYRDIGECSIVGIPIKGFTLGITQFTKSDGDYLSDYNLGEVGDGLMLAQCVGQEIYTYKLWKSYNDLNYRTAMYGLEDGENYTIDFLNSLFEPVLSVKVLGEGGNITFQSLNSTGGYEEFFSIETDYNVTQIDIWMNQTSDTFKLAGYSKTLTFTEKEAEQYISTDIYPISYVQINFTESNDLIQSAFRYSGTTNELNWTTTVPTVQRFYSTGAQPLTLYVSDDIHQPEDYNKSSIIVNIQSGKWCNANAGQNGLLETIKGLGGNAWWYYFVKLSLREKLGYFLAFLFILLIIIFSAIFFKSSGSPKLIYSNLFSASICFVAAFFAKMPIYAVSFAIFASVSLAGIIMRDT